MKKLWMSLFVFCLTLGLATSAFAQNRAADDDADDPPAAAPAKQPAPDAAVTAPRPGAKTKAKDNCCKEKKTRVQKACEKHGGTFANGACTLPGGKVLCGLRPADSQAQCLQRRLSATYGRIAKAEKRLDALDGEDGEIAKLKKEMADLKAQAQLEAEQLWGPGTDDNGDGEISLDERPGYVAYRDNGGVFVVGEVAAAHADVGEIRIAIFGDAGDDGQMTPDEWGLQQHVRNNNRGIRDANTKVDGVLADVGALKLRGGYFYGGIGGGLFTQNAIRPNGVDEDVRGSFGGGLNLGLGLGYQFGDFSLGAYLRGMPLGGDGAEGNTQRLSLGLEGLWLSDDGDVEYGPYGGVYTAQSDTNTLSKVVGEDGGELGFMFRYHLLDPTDNKMFALQARIGGCLGEAGIDRNGEDFVSSLGICGGLSIVFGLGPQAPVVVEPNPTPVPGGATVRRR